MIAKESEAPYSNICVKPAIILSADMKTVKGSCKPAKDGYVTFTADGKVDPNCQAVKDKAISLNKDGSICKQCPAAVENKKFRQGEPTKP